MHARELTADGAAGPSALHLDQIPAEVHAGELAPCLSPQGRRARGPAAPPTCAARPLQVLQACAVRMACGYTTGGLAQAFLLPTVCRRAPHLPASSHKPAAAMLGTRCASQAVQGGARAAVLERAAGGPHCQAVVGAWAAWRAPSFACYIGVKTVLPATSAQTRAWKVVLPTQQSTD